MNSGKRKRQSITAFKVVKDLLPQQYSALTYWLAPQQETQMHLHRIHHVAIICSNYEISKYFYTVTLGLKVVAEAYREERQSYKLDLALPDGAQLELFSFPSPPTRPSRPEACGLRHIAFEVLDIEATKKELESHKVNVEAIRVDEYTNQKFTFFADPDGLPIELYEARK